MPVTRPAEITLPSPSWTLSAQPPGPALRFDVRGPAADLLAAQEEERRRVSRELHDELGQRLALLEIQIEQMERQLGSNAAVYSALESLRGHVGEIADDVHRICCRLHPAILENLGLVVAVRAFCAEFASWSGVKVRFAHSDVPSKLPPAISLCIYRLIQEGLRNVGRHARAHRAVVTIRASESGIEIRVRDNGCGLRTSSAVHNGLGLISLSERVRLLGGSFAIRSAPGRGTRLQAWIPAWTTPAGHAI